jgi:uncharacterized protein (TIRG00374 family)
MKRRLTLILSLFIGLILLAVWLYIIDFREMFGVLKGIRVYYLFPLGLFFIVMYFLRSLRWKIILSPVERITAFESFKLCMTSYFINFLVPVHAGEVAKSVLLKKRRGTPVSQSLLTVYVDKAMDLLSVFLLLAVTPFLSPQINSIIYPISAVLFLIFLVFILSLVSLYYKKELFFNVVEKIFFFLPARIKKKFRDVLNLFVEGIFSLPRLSGRLWQITGLTLLALLFHCLFLWLFFFSFGIKLPALTVFVGYLLLNASFLLPAPPGFAGSLELTIIFIFTYLFGYDKNLVSAVAASSHIFSALLFGLIGLSSIALIGTKLSLLMKIESGTGEFQSKVAET